MPRLHRAESSVLADPPSTGAAAIRTEPRATVVPQGMLIVNADDWGGWKSATDAALACYEKNRITSVSAMVFMEDSERAAALAEDLEMDVGLHVNFNQHLTASRCPARLQEKHARIKHFLDRNKYAQLLYHPLLRREFREVYHLQAEEFARLYGRSPSHIDGHRHLHLCLNMLLDGIIPRGQKVRRSFSFWPGEKSFFNRAYRGFVDGRVTRRHRTTDYFFALSQCFDNQRMSRVEQLARTSNVELMTHPEKPAECEWLMGEAYMKWTKHLKVCSYAQL